MNTVLLKFLNFALKPEVCEMVGYFWLQNGLKLLCRVCPSGHTDHVRLSLYMVSIRCNSC